MSRIDDLLAQHCPNGVESRRLKEVARIRNGRDYKGFDVGNVPVYGTGGVMTFIDTPVYDRPSVLIPRKGSLNKLYFVDQPFWTVDTIFYTEIFDHMLPKFFYYFLQTQHLEDLNQAGGVPSLTQSVLNELRVPVPPLEVQREIVRILDAFTALEAELEAELEARRQQYAHYRSSILDLGEDVAWRPLRDVAEVRSGWGFPRSYQGQVDGDLPFLKVSDMNLRGNETVMHSSNNYVTWAVARSLGTRPAPEGTVIFPKIGAAVATNKKRLLAVPSVYDNNVMGLVPGRMLEPRFLYHWMTTIDLTRLAHNSGAVPSIRSSEMADFRIPVPDLTEQRQIIAALDTFNAMVSDLSLGLPAELAARRKQYEYYRDRLLSFEEAPS